MTLKHEAGTGKDLNESLQGYSFFLTNGNAQNHRGINELQINKILTFTEKKRLKEAQGILKKKEGKRTCFSGCQDLL